jgi:predicted MPP superfamily phosphohydrolase
VQLSDLHINKYTHPAILPDLLAFGGAVLSGVRPQALLITGDLVDAKTKAEGSQQHPEEWQVGCSFYFSGVVGWGESLG